MRSPGADAQAAQLADGLRQLGLAASSAQLDRWLLHVSLLCEWNKAYNLTATRKPADIISRHVLDSLSIAPHLCGSRILDIGTGAGFPGIPLAVLFPDREFHLLDSNGKKMRFLFQVKRMLALDNVVLHQERVEALRENGGYDCVVSRAFASLGEMLRMSAHLCAPQGCHLAMKASLSEAEANAVHAPYTVAESIPLHVPGAAAARRLIKIVRTRTQDHAAGISHP